MVQTKQVTPPDLSTVLQETQRATKVTLNSINIGIIESFNPSNQTATIRVAIKQVQSVLPDGKRIFVEHPLLIECPVMTLFGGGSFINLPIAPGDTCIILFNDREIDNWLNNGGVQAPTSSRVHDISDALAIVGIRSYQNSIADFLAAGIRISFSANSRMDFTEDEINSIADLFTHDGDFTITGILNAAEAHIGDGASGTFDIVTVVDGIVVGGS